MKRPPGTRDAAADLGVQRAFVPLRCAPGVADNDVWGHVCHVGLLRLDSNTNTARQPSVRGGFLLIGRRTKEEGETEGALRGGGGEARRRGLAERRAPGDLTPRVEGRHQPTRKPAVTGSGPVTGAMLGAAIDAAAEGVVAEISGLPRQNRATAAGAGHATGCYPACPALAQTLVLYPVAPITHQAIRTTQHRGCARGG
jgi:hypothetical protein